MNKLKQLFAAVLLATALVASVHAGDMATPPADPPAPDHMTSSSTAPATDGQGTQSLATPNAATDVSILAFDAIWDLLSTSMY